MPDATFFSEPIVTAIIALASAFVGAAAGVIGNIVTTRKQLKQLAFESMFAARLSAYRDFYIYYSEFLADQSDEKYIALAKHISLARLVGSESTISCLEDLLRLAEAAHSGIDVWDKFDELKPRLNKSMQDDLNRVDTPKIR